MATIIDALLVTLGLDSKQFSEGSEHARHDLTETKNHAKREAEEIKKAGEEAAEFFTEMAEKAQRLFIVLAGGYEIKEFIEKTVSAEVAALQFSKSIGVNMEELEAWQGAVQRTGGTAEGFKASLSSLNDQIERIAITGKGRALPFFKSLGVSVKDAAGHAKPAFEVMQQLAEKFEGMDAGKSLAIGKRLGLDEGTIKLLQSGSKNVEELLKRQKELGLASKEDAEEAEKFEESMKDLKQTSESFGRGLLADVIPMLTAFFEGATKISLWARQHGDFIKATFIGIGAVIGTYFLPEIIEAAIATWAALAPFLAIAAVAVTVGAALGLLFDDWSVWMKGGKSQLGEFWQFFADVWKQIAPIVYKVMYDVKEYFTDAWNVIKDIVHLFVAIFSGDTKSLKDIFAKLMKDLGALFWDIVSIWEDLIKGFGPFIIQAFKNLISVVINIIKSLPDAFIWLFNKNIEVTESFFELAWELFKSAVSGWISLIEEIFPWFQQHFPIISSIVKNVFEVAKWIITTTVNGWKLLVQAFYDWFHNRAGIIPDTFHAVAASVTGIWNSLWVSLKAAAASVIDWVTSKLDTIVQGFAKVKQLVGFGGGNNQVLTGTGQANGAPSQAITQATPSAAVAPGVVNNSKTQSVTKHSETSIGSIVINTNGPQDAQGIAGQIGNSIKSNSLIDQADTGLS